VFRQSGRIGDGAEGKGDLLGQHVQGTFVAAGLAWNNHTTLSLESYTMNAKLALGMEYKMIYTLCSSIDDGNDAGGIFRVIETHDSCVHPTPGLDRIQSANDERELPILA
jgi:hypothetical protein